MIDVCFNFDPNENRLRVLVAQTDLVVVSDIGSEHVLENGLILFLIDGASLSEPFVDGNFHSGGVGHCLDVELLELGLQLGEAAALVRLQVDAEEGAGDNWNEM